MDTFSGDIGGLIFKSQLKGNMGQFSLDGQMLSVLMNLDGIRDCAEVARTVNMPSSSLRRVLEALSKMGLIERVQAVVPVVDEDFAVFLRSSLARAVGPIAEILIEDTLEEINVLDGQIPRGRAAELVESLARQIPREDKRLVFQQEMIKKIAAKKY